MLKQLEIEALKADLEAVSSLLASATKEEDPIGHFQFTSRKEELEQRLSQLQDLRESRGSVGLFFGGSPVIGSRGIVANFGAKAVEEFQNVVATRLAARSGTLGRRGPVPQTGRAQMLITDAVRGSFGFVLEEHGSPETDQDNDTELKEVMEEVVEILHKTTKQDETDFEEAREEMDDRVLHSVQSFFSLLDSEGATLRILENGREFIFNHEAISRAKTRTDNTDIEDNTVEMTGQLYIMPNSRQFELKTMSGDFIRGKITAESLRSITEENGDIGAGALGTWCVVSILIHNVRKSGIIAQTSYRLLDVISTKNPHPGAPPV